MELTARKIEVIALLGQGLNDSQIAAQLGISKQAVGQHRKTLGQFSPIVKQRDRIIKDLLPKSVDVCDNILDNGQEENKVRVALNLLKGTGVLVEKTETETITRRESLELKRQEVRIEIAREFGAQLPAGREIAQDAEVLPDSSECQEDSTIANTIQPHHATTDIDPDI